MDKMEISSKILKHFIITLTLCYGASAKCSKEAIVVDKDTIKFHPLPVNEFKSNLSLKYDSSGLQPLFNLANSFMDTVQPKNFGEVFGGEDLKKLKDWKYVLKSYEIPIAICIGIGLLFVIFMPIVGFCFCCCRCCGKCGGDMKQSEKKSSQHCKVAFMVFLLFVFTVLMLCGTLFMFVTNDRMNEAHSGLFKTYDNAIEEAEQMADIVIMDVDNLVADQVPCLTNLLRENIDNSSLTQKIGIPLRKKVSDNVATAMDRGLAVSKNIDNIVEHVSDIKTKDESIKKEVNTLKSEIEKIKDDLKSVVTKCNSKGITQICDELEDIKVDIKMDFDGIPNIAQYLVEMQKVKGLKLADNIKKANQTINNIPDTVLTESSKAASNVRKFLDDTDETIREKGEKITEDIRTKVDELKGNMTSNAAYKTAKKDSNQYERIRWKVYIALSALMAFIVFILVCGLTCGSCGYNKEYMPTERTTTSNCGGNCLMAAVGLMFIFSFILMIFCVIWFTVGIHIHLVCRELKDGEFIDTVVNMVKEDSLINRNISVKNILKNCRNDFSIYRATSPYIEDNYNLTKMIKFEKINEVRETIIKEMNFDLSKEKILTTTSEEALNDMINSKIDTINFTKFFNILSDKITTQNLEVVITNLTNIETNVESTSKDVATDINHIKGNITYMKDETIVQLSSSINGLKVAGNELEKELKDMKVDSTKLLADLKKSQDFLQKDTPTIIKTKVLELADLLIGYVRKGKDHILDQAKNNAAKCKPIANIYDGIINTFMCDNLVQNSNGFWLALGWCLLFFIPTIILSVKLAKYFRRMEYTAGMDTIVVDHPPYNDKLPPHSNKGPYSTPGYSHDMRPPPPYTSTQHSNPGYQHV